MTDRKLKNTKAADKSKTDTKIHYKKTTKNAFSCFFQNFVNS